VRRTLVIANRTPCTPVLLQEVERRAGARPTAFTVLIPQVSSRRSPDWTAAEALKALRRAARGPNGVLAPAVDALESGADAFESIRAALAAGGFHDIVICTRPSRWRRGDLVRRIEALGVPTLVIAEPGDGARGFEKVLRGTTPILPGY
jgi:pimeloyl-ACP methyl ester carboxylesterase